MFDRIPAQLTRQTRIRLNINNGHGSHPWSSVTHDGAGALGGLQQQDVQRLTLIEQEHIQAVSLARHSVTAPGGHPAISGQDSHMMILVTPEHRGQLGAGDHLTVTTGGPAPALRH